MPVLFIHEEKNRLVKGYYTILGIKEDGSREVLSVVNHPTEGALLWQLELESLKERGVQIVGLIVSDGLTSIENVISKYFPNAQHQLCVALLRIIKSVIPVLNRFQMKEIQPILLFELSCFYSANDLFN